jgi:hypothetical protein
LEEVVNDMAELLHPLVAHCKIAEALGLGGQPIERLVVLADVRGPVRVYVKRVMNAGDLPALCDALKTPGVEVAEVDGVEVGADGCVTVVPKG